MKLSEWAKRIAYAIYGLRRTKNKLKKLKEIINDNN